MRASPTRAARSQPAPVRPSRRRYLVSSRQAWSSSRRGPRRLSQRIRSSYPIPLRRRARTRDGRGRPGAAAAGRLRGRHRVDHRLQARLRCRIRVVETVLAAGGGVVHQPVEQQLDDGRLAAHRAERGAVRARLRRFGERPHAARRGVERALGGRDRRGERDAVDEQRQARGSLRTVPEKSVPRPVRSFGRSVSAQRAGPAAGAGRKSSASISGAVRPLAR